MTQTIKDHQLKITVGTAIVVVIFIVTSAVSVSGAFKDQQNRLDQFDIKSEIVSDRTRANSAALHELGNECQETAVQYADINARLVGIETLLLEMRSR